MEHWGEYVPLSSRYPSLLGNIQTLMAPTRIPAIPTSQLTAYATEYPAQSAIFAATLGVAVSQPLNANDPPVLGAQATALAKLLVRLS